MASFVVMTGREDEFDTEQEGHEDGEISHRCGRYQAGNVTSHYDKQQHTVTIMIRPFLYQDSYSSHKYMRITALSTSEDNAIPTAM